MEKLEEVLDWLQPQGLDGLEVFHKQYSAETKSDFCNLAERRGLLTIAGSDYHGLHQSDGAAQGSTCP